MWTGKLSFRKKKKIYLVFDGAHKSQHSWVRSRKWLSRSVCLPKHQRIQPRPTSPSLPHNCQLFTTQFDWTRANITHLVREISCALHEREALNFAVWCVSATRRDAYTLMLWCAVCDAGEIITHRRRACFIWHGQAVYTPACRVLCDSNRKQ